jgi:molybdopterin/thiamine biosynthesis adenylyltransferase
MSLAEKTIALVGVGGLGCPAALALCKAGIGRLLLIDDDVVDETNLHRQILYSEADVGQRKLPAAVAALQREASGTQVRAVNDRCLPDNALQLLRDADLILEGADNYATKFLVADAGHLLGKPVVHGAAVGWLATVFAVSPAGLPCYRCIFEDVPNDAQSAPNCDSVGVMGPLTGFAGALMADLALRALTDGSDFGALYGYDGKTDRLRRTVLMARASCPLCGDRCVIKDTNESRYLAPSCAA